MILGIGLIAGRTFAFPGLTDLPSLGRRGAKELRNWKGLPRPRWTRSDSRGLRWLGQRGGSRARAGVSSALALLGALPWFRLYLGLSFGALESKHVLARLLKVLELSLGRHVMAFYRMTWPLRNPARLGSKVGVY